MNAYFYGGDGTTEDGGDLILAQVLVDRKN
jgi:hypothetical protein